MKPIHFLINATDEQAAEITSQVFEIFEGTGIRYHLHIDGGKAFLKDPDLLNDAGLIAVYGGDGSVTESATALIGTDIPLAIIPGGTANVLSKELNIPQNTGDALRLLRDGHYRLQTIDTGLVNDEPFLLRVNLGIMADMIVNADLELKSKIGQLAYGVSVIKAITDAKPRDYQLTIDGKQMEVSAVSITVTNSGNMGVGDLQLQPGISITDGLLDIVILGGTGLLTLLKAAGGSLFNMETDAVSHYTCSELIIEMDRDEIFICDDCETTAHKLTIGVKPSSLKVVVPLND